VQDGLSKNLRSPDKGVLCPFGPLGADYRESESRKGSEKAAFAYRFVNCNEISVINQRFLNYFIFVSRVASPVYGIWIVKRYKNAYQYYLAFKELEK